MYRSVIPDSTRVRLPSEPNLQIMIIRNQIQQHLLEIITFRLGDIIILIDMQSNSVHRILAGYRIGADSRVLNNPVFATVLGMSTRFGPEFKTTVLLGAEE